MYGQERCWWAFCTAEVGYFAAAGMMIFETFLSSWAGWLHYNQPRQDPLEAFSCICKVSICYLMSLFFIACASLLQSLVESGDLLSCTPPRSSKLLVDQHLCNLPRREGKAAVHSSGANNGSNNSLAYGRWLLQASDAATLEALNEANLPPTKSGINSCVLLLHRKWLRSRGTGKSAQSCQKTGKICNLFNRTRPLMDINQQSYVGVYSCCSIYMPAACVDLFKPMLN